MTNQNQSQPASNYAKQLISLWNSSLNSFFIQVEVEDGPNPPELVVNVRSSEKSYVATVKKEVSLLGRIMETATIQRIPIAKNGEGEWVPTTEGQKMLEESGTKSDYGFYLNMALKMAMIDTSALDELSAEDFLSALQALPEEDSAESTDEQPSIAYDVREKIIGEEDGQEITHLTINVLANDETELNELTTLQKEIAQLHKDGKITVQLKPYTEDERKAF